MVTVCPSLPYNNIAQFWLVERQSLCMRTHKCLPYKCLTVRTHRMTMTNSETCPRQEKKKKTRADNKLKRESNTMTSLLTTTSRPTSNGAVLSNPILKLLYYSWSVWWCKFEDFRDLFGWAISTSIRRTDADDDQGCAAKSSLVRIPFEDNIMVSVLDPVLSCALNFEVTMANMWRECAPCF